jgi:hypothetical protein
MRPPSFPRQATARLSEHLSGMKSLPLLALVLALAVPVAVRADQSATFHGTTTDAENASVSQLSSYLMSRYPTAASAEHAGYFRYTTEDETGAISYANFQWYSRDLQHPSQLWYDKDGKLLGADYSVPLSVSATRPQLWGINPGRWVEFDGHIHWVAKDPATGALIYNDNEWAWDKAFTAAGGDPNQPTAVTLVAMKKVTSTSEVVKVFHFPAIWDLIVWVKPNPNGAFAWKNPNVTP